MIYSMTGFGKGEAEQDGNLVMVEIRSLNGRFFDPTFRISSAISELEPKLRGLLQRRISRGRVHVSVLWHPSGSERPPPSLNLQMAQGYMKALRDMKDVLGVEGKIDLALLSEFQDIFNQEEPEPDLDLLWNLVKQASKAALSTCNQMRQAEGAAIYKDFLSRIDTIENKLKEIEVLTAARVKAISARLRKKIEAVLRPGEIEETRLATEIALLAERSDITEECVRFHSHNKQFIELLKSGEPVGRRINFLLQEMGREANTIGAKANDANISHIVVGIKEELEKLREQAQNLE